MVAGQLLSAAENGNMEEIKRLLSVGVDLDAKGRQRQDLGASGVVRITIILLIKRVILKSAEGVMGTPCPSLIL